MLSTLGRTYIRAKRPMTHRSLGVSEARRGADPVERAPDAGQFHDDCPLLRSVVDINGVIDINRDFSEHFDAGRVSLRTPTGARIAAVEYSFWLATHDIQASGADFDDEPQEEV